MNEAKKFDPLILSSMYAVHINNAKAIVNDFITPLQEENFALKAELEKARELAGIVLSDNQQASVIIME
tara:strand:- start:226 stop:432 length:207 start_codon:yes stop_codon:yes gene_type:complete